MGEIKTFKIEQKFNDIEELYNYLFRNIKFIEEATCVKIQKPLSVRMHCIIGYEKRIASRGRMVDGVGLCEQDEQVNRKTRLTRATKQIKERNILFFATKSGFTESLGELITLASVFEADIIIFFVNDAHKNYLGCLSWLQEICNEDTRFIVGEADF